MKEKAKSSIEKLKGAQSAWRKAGWGSGFNICQSINSGLDLMAVSSPARGFLLCRSRTSFPSEAPG